MESPAEWVNNEVFPSEASECDGGQSPNSRTGKGHRWETPSGGGTPTEDPSGWPFGRLYDAAGNLKTDGRHFFDYDGSNRLVDVYRLDTLLPASLLNPGRGTKVAHYEYDGLGRHVLSVYDTDGDGSMDGQETEWTPRDHLGRPLGIWRQRPQNEEDPQCARAYQLFGYHSTGFRGTGYDASGGILDCPAVRWRDADNDDETGEDGLEETLHYLQDFRGDVTALSDATGIVERIRYGPTGRPETFPIADINFDGIVDTTDQDAMDDSIDAFDTDNADYDPRADLNRDGVVNAKDAELFDASYGAFAGPGNQWKLSQGTGITPGKAADGYDNRFGWRGYWYDGYLQKYHVRHRVYDPRQGRWMQTDPLGFDAGDQDLYRYAGGEYSTGYDPLGLAGTAYTTGTFQIGGGAPDPCEEANRQHEFGDPNAGNRRDTLDHFTNFFAGAADGISFGLTADLRREWGQSDVVDTQSGLYGAGVGVGVALDFAIAGGAGGAAYMATLEGSIVGGALMGVGSDAIVQRSQMMAGVRDEFNVGRLAGAGAMGGAFGAVGYGAGRYVVTPLWNAGSRVVSNAAARFSGRGGQVVAETAEAVGGSCGCGNGASRSYVELTIDGVRAPNQGPLFPYNRVRAYGNTPTAADRLLGRTDHRPSLVERWYEGDPAANELPGFLLSDAERAASTADPTRLFPPDQSYQSQGGMLKAYSMRMRKYFFGY